MYFSMDYTHTHAEVEKDFTDTIRYSLHMAVLCEILEII